MSAWSIVLLCSFVINIMLVITMIFIERRKPQSIISWLVILMLFPILGFVFYIFVGSGLSLKTRKMIRTMQAHNKEYQEYADFQRDKLLDTVKHSGDFAGEIEEFILFNINSSDSICFLDNDVEIFTCGKDKIEALKKDLEAAKSSINIMYYIFAGDKVGKEVMEILIRKAKSGVKVNFIYDSIGCIRTGRRFYNKLKKAGGNVQEFFPPLFGIRLINFKLNYRNHKKIVVIDGEVGYVGGINIRDDHMGDKKRLSPWRDTHARIVGEAVFGLQTAFFNDLRFCSGKHTTTRDLEKLGYYPKYESHGDVAMQIVTSGPDRPQPRIKDSMVKMMSLAKQRIVLQTPYFIPDDIFLSMIAQAISSGVRVDIMIPKKPDKKIVYWATLSYIRDVLLMGANVYLYDGFIHSKVMIVDDKFATIGTTNADNRSFYLNFEINAFMFGKEIANKNLEIFEKDISNSLKIDSNYLKKKGIPSSMAQTIFRLFSPLL
ncbi:MAG: cardiolipin synthase [Clostridia bacterium]